MEGKSCFPSVPLALEQIERKTTPFNCTPKKILQSTEVSYFYWSFGDEAGGNCAQRRVAALRNRDCVLEARSITYHVALIGTRRSRC